MNCPKEISKEEINRFDLYRYDGEVVMVRTREKADQACRELLKETVIGLDTETRPAFRKGQSFKPSLLQMAVSDRVFIFKIRQTGIPNGLKRVFEDANILKAGVAIHDDLNELKEISAFEGQGIVELNEYFRDLGFVSLGIRKLAALVLGIRVSKSQQTSNWDAPKLKPQQIRYAATDAWVCRELYLASQRAFQNS